jgi:hypothetical protein
VFLIDERTRSAEQTISGVGRLTFRRKETKTLKMTRKQKKFSTNLPSRVRKISILNVEHKDCGEKRPASFRTVGI